MTAVTFRPATEDDMRLVFDSWAKSYAKSTGDRYHVSGARSDLLMSGFDRHLMRHGIVEEARQILAQPGTRVTVCCSAESPSTIAGWACSTGPVLHYVFVKESCRRHGIATELARGAEWITFRTPDCSYVPALACLRHAPQLLVRSTYQPEGET